MPVPSAAPSAAGPFYHLPHHLPHHLQQPSPGYLTEVDAGRAANLPAPTTAR